MEGKRNRTRNYTNYEKTLLMKIARLYKTTIENKKIDSASNKEKNNTWEKIAKIFNLSCRTFQTALEAQPRNGKQLRELYSFLKRQDRNNTLSTDDNNVDFIQTEDGLFTAKPKPVEVTKNVLIVQYEPDPNHVDSKTSFHGDEMCKLIGQKSAKLMMVKLQKLSTNLGEEQQMETMENSERREKFVTDIKTEPVTVYPPETPAEPTACNHVHSSEPPELWYPGTQPNASAPSLEPYPPSPFSTVSEPPSNPETGRPSKSTTSTLPPSSNKSVTTAQSKRPEKRKYLQELTDTIIERKTTKSRLEEVTAKKKLKLMDTELELKSKELEMKSLFLDRKLEMLDLDKQIRTKDLEIKTLERSIKEIEYKMKLREFVAMTGN